MILVLLLSTIMVEHIYCKSYEDEANYFDLDDYEENSDDYLDFEPEDIEEEGDFTSMHNRPPVYKEQKTTPEEKAKKSKCYKECGTYFLKRGKEFEDGKTCFDSCMTTLIELAPSASTGARQVQQMPFQAARRVAARCKGKCNKIRIPENCEAICEKKVHSASSGGYNVEIDCANCIIDEKCGEECSPPNSSECTTCKNNIRI